MFDQGQIDLNNLIMIRPMLLMHGFDIATAEEAIGVVQTIIFSKTLDLRIVMFELDSKSVVKVISVKCFPSHIEGNFASIYFQDLIFESNNGIVNKKVVFVKRDDN